MPSGGGLACVFGGKCAIGRSASHARTHVLRSIFAIPESSEGSGGPRLFACVAQASHTLSCTQTAWPCHDVHPALDSVSLAVGLACCNGASRVVACCPRRVACSVRIVVVRVCVGLRPSGGVLREEAGPCSTGNTKQRSVCLGSELSPRGHREP